MKKFLAITLVLCMVLVMGAWTTLSGAEYTLGMGVVVSTDSSKTNNAQVDATVAAVILDKDGKIVDCRIDCAQSKMDVTDGEVDPAKEFLSKVELKEDYNMVKFSDATLEWYQQAANFEAFTVGKTAEEVVGTETVLNDSGHTVFVDETLRASVSISVADMQAAVAKACADDQAVTFTASGDVTFGLACNTKADESVAATEDEEGVVKMYTEFAAVVLDSEGKVLACVEDAIQPQIKIDDDGEIGDITFRGTKRELKEDYNMVAYSEATLEWYEQAWNFVNFAVGKTAEELRATETVENGSHTVFADEELHASCSISIAGMIEVIAKAAPAGEADGDLMVTITFLVVHGDGSQKEFVINTEGFTLREALEQENLIEGTEGQWGLYVLTVDGETVDEAQQQWWCLTKNGEMSMTGVDDTIISDGDHYEFTFTIGW